MYKKYILLFISIFVYHTHVQSANPDHTLLCSQKVGTILGATIVETWKCGLCCTRPATKRFTCVRSTLSPDHDHRAGRFTGYCTLGCCFCAAGECAACCCGPTARIPCTIAASAAYVTAAKQTCYCQERNEE